MKNFPFVFVLVILFAAASQAQTSPVSYAGNDPLTNISAEMTVVSRSVQALTQSMKAFVDKFEKVGGTTFNEKQQKLVLAMEFLVRAEERVGNLQRLQVELVEKQGATRTRLAQVERDLYPQSIDRSTAFEGTTKTEEIRESRRTTLTAERASLQSLLQQINSNIGETTEALRDAQQLAWRLRRQYLPQIEKEIFEQ